METINLYGFQLDFVKDLLREYLVSKSSDQDTRMLARDVLDQINAQHPDTVREISLLTGELVEIPVA